MLRPNPSLRAVSPRGLPIRSGPLGLAASLISPTQSPQRRSFHVSTRKETDGVYKALTEMRVRTPWIEALKKSKESKTESGDSGAAYSHDSVNVDCTPKKMSDSYVSFVLPLSKDPWLLDTYGNFTGQVRTGTLLMDLDALAGVVAYRHTGEGVSTVTAAVDRITIKVSHSSLSLCFCFLPFSSLLNIGFILPTINPFDGKCPSLFLVNHIG